MMENQNPYPNPNLDPIPAENTFVSTAEDEAEAKRKELSYKRMTVLFIVLSVIVLAFILWEVVDLMMGGRP